MTGEEILKTYPKVTNLLTDWFTRKMMESAGDAEGNVAVFRDILLKENVVDKSLVTIIDNNPRGLFDLFDSHDVLIDILIESPMAVDILFGYRVYPRDLDFDDPAEWYSTRKEAERAAVEDAIKLLNEQL